MADDDGEKRHAIAPPHHYASEVSLNLAPADATISFGRAYTLVSPEGEVIEGQKTKEWFVAVVVSPTTLKSMAQVLNIAVKHYEQTHGTIPTGGEIKTSPGVASSAAPA